MCGPRRPVHLRQRKDRPKANHKMLADTPQIGHQYLHIRTRDRLALNHQKWRCKRIVVVSSTSPPVIREQQRSSGFDSHHYCHDHFPLVHPQRGVFSCVPFATAPVQYSSHPTVALFEPICRRNRPQNALRGIGCCDSTRGGGNDTSRCGVHPFTRTPCVGGRRRSRRDTVFIDVRIACVVVALGKVLTQLKSA
jgi:hypothetical protein